MMDEVDMWSSFYVTDMYAHWFHCGMFSFCSTCICRASQIKNLTFIDATPFDKAKARAANNATGTAESSDDDREFTRRKKPARIVRAHTVTQSDIKTEEPKQRRRSNSCKYQHCVVPLVYELISL